MTLLKLSAHNILELLNTHDLLGQKFNVIVEDSLESTNDYLMQRITHDTQLTPCTVVLAEEQTKGKGRHGRNWVSPPGNLFLSLYWPFAGNIEKLYGLSLVVGIAIARVLQANGLDAVRLKWPNDIYWQECKMGGILIETKNKADLVKTVIGIGLNIMDSTNSSIGQKTTCLEKALQRTINRDRLVVEILVELDMALTRFAQHGFTVFVDEWKHFDAGINSNTLDMDLFTRIISADPSLSGGNTSFH